MVLSGPGVTEGRQQFRGTVSQCDQVRQVKNWFALSLARSAPQLPQLRQQNLETCARALCTMDVEGFGIPSLSFFRPPRALHFCSATSTRRFSALPFVVALSATGRVAPNP